uniref:Uncharacterized protein n=1 Tax=Panagrolaimus sp. PS1159 TaxID=55785 RepID=A0AC35GDC8_9BILA
MLKIKSANFKEEALARMAESDAKLQKMREKIRQTEKRLHQLQKQKNIKPESDLTREDLSAAELMAVLKKQPKKFKK